jgi:signal transduction histidine kinase
MAKEKKESLLPDERLIQILEKQKEDLVIRFLKKNEEAKSSNLLIDKIMSNLSDLFVVLSKEYEVVQASHEFYDVLGYNEATPGLTLRAIINDDNFQILVNSLAAGEFRNLETSLLTSGGKVVPVTVRGSTYTTESGRILHILIASNRSELYELMEQMRETQNQLIHSGRLASLGEMAAGVGHELTQPLNTILLLARNCIKAMNDPVQNREMLQENLLTIVDRVNHSSYIIRSLKGFAGKVRGEAVPIKVNAILLDVISFLEPQLQLSEITLDLAIDENISWVLAQEVRLEQVLLNLIQNAIQALASTSVPVLRIATFKHIETDPITAEDKVYVGISVTDNGEGILPEVLDKIFDPFFTTREVGSGTGLGLSIAERIVRGFNGRITVESEPGIKTSFTVYLPELFRPHKPE